MIPGPALVLLLAAQADAGVAEAPAGVKLVATSTIAWVAKDGIIVVHHRKGVCPPTFQDACGPGLFDKDVHTLRAVSLASGKEKWRNTKTPLLLGELRSDDGEERVLAIVATDVRVHNVALLKPATGKPLATCAMSSDRAGDAASVRFQTRHVDATGAFSLQRMSLKHGGAPPPPVAPLLLRATSTTSCTLVEGAATAPLSWPHEDDRVRYGGDGARGHIDVTIDGLSQRIVIDEQPRCRRFACKPIP